MSMKWLSKWVFETFDDIWYGQLRLWERFGIDQQLKNEIYKISDSLVHPLLKAVYNLECEGVENIPTEGRAVVCVNHQSELDPIVFGVILNRGPKPRRLHQMAKVELFQTPLVSSWVRTHFAFPVRRGENDIQAFMAAKDLLESDELVGMFPEGTLNPGMGRFLEPHIGAARLAYETNSPILPIAIYGTDLIFGKGAKMPQFKGKIKAQVGELMSYDELFKKGDPNSDPKFYKKTMKKVMGKIQDMYFALFQEMQKKEKSEEKSD